jgi:hypothetical protein
MEALKEAKRHLAEYQKYQDLLERQRTEWKELDGGPRPAKEARELAQTYALVSIADSLHELTERSTR